MTDLKSYLDELEKIIRRLAKLNEDKIRQSAYPMILIGIGFNEKGEIIKSSQ